MKKSIIFIISQLAVGGAQKSMIKALSVLDYSKYDVTLYLRKNQVALLSDVPKKVNVIINDNNKNYAYHLIPVVYHILGKVSGIFKLKKLERLAREKARDYVVNSKNKYEKKKFFSDGITYDIAIAYMNGYVCEFTADFIDAKKKICFYLGSDDPAPDLHKRVLPKFDAIVSDSEGTKDALAGRIPVIKDKISIIYNFVDYMEVRQKSEEAVEFYSDDNKLILCSCGRFSDIKGFDLAVEAARILKEKGISFLWYFVGDGTERAKIDRMIEQYGLGDSICITGIVSNPYPYINRCDVYIQPSYEESYGLTITEARILCKPVVSTSTAGGINQITNMVDGILIEFTGESIANGIMRYVEDKELREKVIENLKNIDYSQKINEFKRKWENLLEA